MVESLFASVTQSWVSSLVESFFRESLMDYLQVIFVQAAFAFLGSIFRFVTYWVNRLKAGQIVKKSHLLLRLVFFVCQGWLSMFLVYSITRFLPSTYMDSLDSSPFIYVLVGYGGVEIADRLTRKARSFLDRLDVSSFWRKRP